MTYLILIACCVVGSGFFSGVETALISASRVKIRHLAKSGNPKAVALEGFLAKPERILSAALVGNNIFVVLGSILAATYTISLLDYREGLGMAVATIVMTPIMLVFGETLPKTLFYQHANWMVLRIVPVLTFCSMVFDPLVRICSLPSQLILKLTGGSSQRKNPFVTREELKLLIIEEQSDLKAAEQEMIGHLFKFSETVARSIMVPLEQVVAVDVRGTVGDAAAKMRDSGHSRVLLFDGQLQKIVGHVAVQDILGLNESLSLSRVRRPVVFVPENKRISEILLILGQVGYHMAVVVNRYRRVSGLVTREDIIEEIVGEIEDEYDAPSSTDD
jgi:CBS domain containing-hemolysin-like protein